LSRAKYTDEQQKIAQKFKHLSKRPQSSPTTLPTSISFPSANQPHLTAPASAEPHLLKYQLPSRPTPAIDSSGLTLENAECFSAAEPGGG